MSEPKSMESASLRPFMLTGVHSSDSAHTVARFVRLQVARREWKDGGDIRVVSEVDCYINSDHIRLIESEPPTVVDHIVPVRSSDDQWWTRVKLIDGDVFYVRGTAEDVVARMSSDV